MQCSPLQIQMHWCETDKTLLIHFFFVCDNVVCYRTQFKLRSDFTQCIFRCVEKSSIPSRFFIIFSPIHIFFRVFYSCYFFLSPQWVHTVVHEKRMLVFCSFINFYLFTWNYRCQCNEIETIFSIYSSFFFIHHQITPHFQNIPPLNENK